MPYAGVVQRAWPNAGRDRDKTYVRVLRDVREFSPVGQSLADWLAANPNHPWNDPTYPEYVVEISQAEYQAVAGGSNLLFHDVLNQPRWQQQNDNSGSVKAFGSFADPESAASAFTADTPLVDDRWIVRIYDDDPVLNGSANHLSTEDLDQNDLLPTVLRYLRLFTFEDVATNTNAGNQRTEIGGKLIDFDFGASGAVSAGVATFSIRVSVPGVGQFPSNHRYRVVGPNGEKKYRWNVFGKIIDVDPG